MAQIPQQQPAQRTFDEWLNGLTRREIWETRGGMIIHMGTKFVEGFNAIIKALCNLNGREEFSGNLRASVRFSREAVGRASRLVATINEPHNQLAAGYDHLQNDLKVSQGLKIDLEALRRIVTEVASKFAPQALPDDIRFFNYAVYSPPRAWVGPQWAFQRRLREMKKLCFANYCHPLFFTKHRWAKFVYKCHEIDKRNRGGFRSYVSLDTGLVNMTGWAYAILYSAHYPDDSPHQSTLCQVLYDRTTTLVNGPLVPPYNIRFDTPGELPNYLRIVLEHGRDLNKRRWFGKNLKMIRQQFSGILSKIFYCIWTELKDDGTCQQEFGSELIKMLRHGIFGYIGFKF